MSTILNKNLEPALTYADIYVQGTVYFDATTVIGIPYTEVPIIREVTEHNHTECVQMPIYQIPIDEVTSEQMIAQGLMNLFAPNCVSVFPATRLYNDVREMYTAILPGGRYNNKPVHTCQIILTRK